TETVNGSTDISVTPVNETPTDLNLDNTVIDENLSPNSVVGTFSTTDSDNGDTFTYALVAGDGDRDNLAFIINGDQLQINETADFETKSSYSIRVQSTDGSGGSYQEQLTINVNNINEAITDLDLDNITISENLPPNSVVGTFSTTDPDNGDTFTYALVAGDGDRDNSAFIINGDQLQINETADFETKSSYSIRVQSTDGSGDSYQEQLTIKVDDVNENSPPIPNPGTIQFSNPTFIVTEGTPTATVTITRTGGSDGIIDAIVNLVEGSATQNQDYSNPNPTIISFADKDTTSQSITIPIIDDNLAEATETVNLFLTDINGNATIGIPNNATLQLFDNDRNPPSMSPIPENLRTRFLPNITIPREPDSLTGGESIVLSLGEVFNVTETTESTTLSFKYTSTNINNQVRFFNINDIEIGSPVTLPPTTVEIVTPIVLPPNTSSVMIGNATTEVEDIQLIVESTPRINTRIANSLNISNGSLFEDFDPYAEVKIIDDYYFKEDSQQLDINSIQKNEYISVPVQNFNELPQFIPEVSFGYNQYI
ncbi:MAG: cadherin domain-containing protein, partial [Trichodesmium sp. MAG_R04]|nr:cadherin domain-containing protein [Trichodesmium sp. MAG_R04]